MDGYYCGYYTLEDRNGSAIVVSRAQPVANSMASADKMSNIAQAVCLS